MLAGQSAGAMCWFEWGVSRSAGVGRGWSPGLGLVPGILSVHYHRDPDRRRGAARRGRAPPPARLRHRRRCRDPDPRRPGDERGQRPRRRRRPGGSSPTARARPRGADVEPAPLPSPAAGDRRGPRRGARAARGPGPARGPPVSAELARGPGLAADLVVHVPGEVAGGADADDQGESKRFILRRCYRQHAAQRFSSSVHLLTGPVGFEHGFDHRGRPSPPALTNARRAENARIWAARGGPTERPRRRPRRALSELEAELRVKNRLGRARRRLRAGAGGGAGGDQAADRGARREPRHATPSSRQRTR